MKSNNFRIVPLPTAAAEEARRAAAAGAPDHKPMTVSEPHTAPCRHCLRWAAPGERVILFPYESIAAGRPYAESGPIFVHAAPCERYANCDTYPAEFREGRVLRAYDENDEIADAVLLNGDPEATIARLFSNPRVSFLQARSATRGCYTFKVERA